MRSGPRLGVPSRDDQALEPRLSMPEWGQSPPQQLPFSRDFPIRPRI